MTNIWIGANNRQSKPNISSEEFKDQVFDIVDLLPFGPWVITTKDFGGLYNCEFTNNSGMIGSIKIKETELRVILNSMDFSTRFKNPDLMLECCLSCLATQLPFMVNQTMELTVALVRATRTGYTS